MINKMYSNPINVGYISEGVSAQSAFQQPLVGPVSTGQLSLQTGTVLHGHNAPPGFTQHYSGIPAPYGTPYSAQYPPQSAILNPWGVMSGVSMGPNNNTNMLVGSSSMTQGGYLPSNVNGMMPTGYTVSRATGTSYTGTFSQAQGGSTGSIPSSVQGLMMPYQTTSSQSGFPSHAASNFQSSVSQASVLPTTSVPIPQSGNIPFNGQGTIVNIVPSTTNIPIQQGSYVPFNGLGTNVNIVPSTTNVRIQQGSYVPFNGLETNVNNVPPTNNASIPQGGYVPISGQDTSVNNVPFTNGVPIPQGIYIPMSSHSTNLNMVPGTYTNSTPIPQGGYLPISGQGTNVNIVPLTNIAPVPHGGVIPFSGQGTNSNLVTATTPQAGYISCTGQGVDLKVMSQTLYPPVQSTQSSNTFNQYLPCTPNQAMLNSTKQQVLTHNHIQPPPGFQQLQPQQVSQTPSQFLQCTQQQTVQYNQQVNMQPLGIQPTQQVNSQPITTQDQLTKQIHAPTLPSRNQQTRKINTQTLQTQINMKQPQQHNSQTQLDQIISPPQHYTMQQSRSNVYHVGQVHQQTQMRDVPCQILQNVPCQNTSMAPALMQDLTPGLTDQVSPTLLHGSNIPPPGAGLTVTGSIQYQVSLAKLQGGYEPLMASAGTESITGNVEKISKMQMPCYNSESVQTVGALKPLTVEVSDQGSSVSGNIILTAKASVCSDHARITQPHGSKQTLMLLQQCQQPHLQGVLAPLLALQLPPEQYMAQPQHQPIMSLLPHQQFVECSQEQQMTLTTIEQQPATMLPKQHLSNLQSSPDHANTKSGNIHSDCGEDDRQDVCNEHEMSDLAEALTDGREQPEVFDTHEQDTLLRTVKRHYVEVYQRLSTLKNHVDSLVTDMQTITKGMEAIDLEQNHLKYDC
ncbi:uncharacterized protein LOC128163913 [Crassostrea angulata]|uniref:uncharacterized protein LOC128163913 n=1 Tax=Magallana angulata TaxID=2784310 RepID=UPI0022B18AFF|nr:uncharacterized protein LOC128163913 [Crassostrea angulata]